MSKRAGPRPTHAQDQADLFGAAAPPLPRKKPRAPQRAHPPSGKPNPSRQSLAAQNAVAGGLLNVRQPAARLGLSKSTLDKMRCAGKGPPFIKSTDRAVRYDPTDLDAWVSERRRQSTK